MPKLSDYVFEFVADQGVKHIFLVTGGGAMHLNESSRASSAIEPVCNSHEQASAIAAENYGKATNRLRRRLGHDRTRRHERCNGRSRRLARFHSDALRLRVR